MKKVNPKTTNSTKLKWKYPTKNGMVECYSISMEEENPKTTKSTKFKENVPQQNGMVEWSLTSMVEMQILKQLIWSLFYFAWTVIERGLCPNQQRLESKCPTQSHGRMEWTTIEVYIGIFMP